MVNAWERYILNPETRIAHDSNHLSEECNTDDIVQKVRKPSIPPDFRLCRHCAMNLLAAGENVPAVVEEEHHEPAADESGRVEIPGVSGAPEPDDPGGDTGDHAGDLPTADGGDGPNGPARPDGEAVLPAAGSGEPGDGPTDTPLEQPVALTGNLQGTPHAGELIAKHAMASEHETWGVSNSSNVRHLDYNIAHATLLVRFANGWEYIYGGVPYDVASQVATSDSPGTAFDAQIKKANFPFERVTKS